MKVRILLLLLIALLVSPTAAETVAEPPVVSAAEVNREVIFQTSTIGALLEGIYDGDTTFAELKQHGDFCIGTFNALDGELAGLDGDFYQIKADGKAYPVDEALQTPFAMATFFDADEVIPVEGPIASYEALQEHLNSLLPSSNTFYAIKIQGDFEYVKTRAPRAQTEPYPRLVEALRDQSIFEFYNVRGVLVGFWLPQYMSALNVAGYHLHFLTEDRSAGGHLLEGKLRVGTIELDCTSEFYLVLSQSVAFQGAALQAELEKEVEQVEN